MTEDNIKLEKIEDFETFIINAVEENKCDKKGMVSKISFPNELIHEISHEKYGVSKIMFLCQIVEDLEKHYGEKMGFVWYSIEFGMMSINLSTFTREELEKNYVSKQTSGGAIHHIK